MNASRAQGMNKRIDFSAASCSIELALLKRIADVGEVSLTAIQKHFSGTPKEFVAKAVEIALLADKLTIRRNGLSRRAGYVYMISDAPTF